ncbi:MAG: DNA-processing protein DprA [Prevotella sp.]|nr:DNA-processing protein DprA [Prevotella sp.]
MRQETLYAMALTRLSYFNPGELLMVYQRAGNATTIMEHRKDIREVFPDCSMRLVEALSGCDEALKRAEAELEYDERYGVHVICYNDDEYPQRLRECPDAPVVLYYNGNADLNSQRVVNIIGTRQCTAYGRDVIRSFVRDLRIACGDVLIVSGLAYGVDVCAHREALANGLPTVGVLAHGLDDLYPGSHRNTAQQMVAHGGLLTEYMTQTNADKRNFVKRNRIVAGMSDACLLVESAAKGGGLITARISRGYNRDVFAFPGKVGDTYSEGCNNMIRDNVAALITCADDFVHAMGWQNDSLLREKRDQGIERDLFPMLNDDERKVAEVLGKTNDLPVNILSVQSGLSVAKLSSLLFEMEMKGVVRMLAGGTYHLIK